MYWSTNGAQDVSRAHFLYLILAFWLHTSPHYPTTLKGPETHLRPFLYINLHAISPNDDVSGSFFHIYTCPTTPHHDYDDQSLRIHVPPQHTILRRRQGPETCLWSFFYYLFTSHHNTQQLRWPGPEMCLWPSFFINLHAPSPHYPTTVMFFYIHLCAISPNDDDKG
jgi:hypothetical protein